MSLQPLVRAMAPALAARLHRRLDRCADAARAACPPNLCRMSGLARLVRRDAPTPHPLSWRHAMRGAAGAPGDRRRMLLRTCEPAGDDTCCPLRHCGSQRLPVNLL